MLIVVGVLINAPWYYWALLGVYIAHRLSAFLNGKD